MCDAAGRRLRAGALSLALPLLASLPDAASAAVVVVDAAAFVIGIDAADSVSVDCSGGFVRVTANGTPTVYTTACSAVTSLAVTAAPPGAFDNTINFSGVTAAAFTSNPTVTISAGGGVDTITGSELEDTITGGPGNETQLGGGGGDTFIWNPGDGSDTLVGGTGADVMIFNGSAGNEVFSMTAQGTGFRFTRDVGSIVMDVTGIEDVVLNAGAGNDSATIGDLTGVAGLTGVFLFMGEGNDVVNASAQASPAVLLSINGNPGDDTLTGSPNTDIINGGAGNDTIFGLGGVDNLLGADGDDTITGGPGNDGQEGGGGNDTFIWNPGDGSDTLLGGTGTDTMVFNGSAGNEVFATTVQGTGFRFTRDVGNIVMNATDVEAITLNALGGDDRVTTVPLAVTSQNLLGGTQTTADVLVIDALGGCVVTTGSGSITIAGAQPITFAEFEQTSVLNQCAAAEDVPTLGPLAMAALALLLVGAAFVAIRIQGSS